MRFERILIIITILALVLKVCGITGGSFLFMISASFLSVVYMVLGVPLILDIKFRDIMSIGKNFSLRCILVSFAAGVIFSSTIIGILYTTLNWMGASSILIASLVPLAILLVINYFLNQKRSGACYFGVFRRGILLGILALICLLIAN